MKKLICVMALVCIGILLVSCRSNRLGDPKAQLMRDFGLHIEKKDCVLEELFNNYEGFPYEGIALYTPVTDLHSRPMGMTCILKTSLWLMPSPVCLFRSRVF